MLNCSSARKFLELIERIIGGEHIGRSANFADCLMLLRIEFNSHHLPVVVCVCNVWNFLFVANIFR